MSTIMHEVILVINGKVIMNSKRDKVFTHLSDSGVSTVSS